MNRRQKIIVSVTGIFLVLLLLVGLTYAYFLTNITGNTNSKSISVSTADLALVYGDDDGSVIGEDEIIMPGTTFEPKTFTVTNEGNADTEYVVVIENVKVTYATTVGENIAGTTTTFESNDFIYTLTCESDGETCDGTTETIFPINGGILVGNKIEVGKTHTYSLTVTYKETGVDQSNDMNKKLEAKVNMADISTINPYKDNTNSLAYNILNNAVSEINGTKLMTKPRTSILENADAGVQYKYVQDNYVSTAFPSGITYYYEDMEFDENTGNSILSNRKETTSNEDFVGNYVDYCNCNDKDPCNCADSFYVESVDGDTFTTKSLWPELSQVIELENNEKVLSITQDDFGTSYYFRGRVLDNYVNYANKCWRVVRILGNGDIKLVLDDNNALCNSDDYSGEHSIGNSMVGTKYNEKLGITIPSYMDLTTATSTLLMYKNYQTNQGSFSTNGIKDYTSVLTNIGWCIEETPYTYEGVKIEDLTDAEYEEWVNGETYDGTFVPGIFFPSYFRGQNNPYSLRCSGYYANKYDTTTDMLVGGLTMDEVIFSGIINYTHPDISSSSYLLNKYESEWSNSNGYYEFNTISLGSNLYYQKEYRASNVDGVYPSEGSVRTRPAVVLKSNINVTGTGTRLDPYEIIFE